MEGYAGDRTGLGMDFFWDGGWGRDILSENEKGECACPALLSARMPFPLGCPLGVVGQL
jgi:hypothetical protein